MPHAMSGDCRIYYESHGAGTALVFIHGAGGNHAAWWQQVTHFRATHRVIAVDLRGFGESDTVGAGPDALDFPNDVRAVLSHAQVERAVLIGQSIGAVAALRCAMGSRQIVAGVILANSVGGLNHPQLQPLVKADRAEAEKLPVLDRLLTRRFQEEEPQKTFLFQQLGSFNHARMQDVRNVSTPGPTTDEVNASGLPVCFIAGENDAVLRPATARAAKDLLTHSFLDVVAGAPHSMYWEAPKVFNQALERSLQQIEGGAR